MTSFRRMTEGDDVIDARVFKLDNGQWVNRPALAEIFLKRMGRELTDDDWDDFVEDRIAKWALSKREAEEEIEAIHEAKVIAEDPEGAIIREAQKQFITMQAKRHAVKKLADQDAEDRGIQPGADWIPIPLSEVSSKPLRPRYGLREDYAACFYKQKLNLVFGESESGKTWLALLATIQTVQIGGRVVMIDFEDSADSIKSRLYTLGLEEHEEELITYINPATSLSEEGRDKLAEYLVQADLCIIDATSEGMAAYGLSSNSDVDVAEFYGALPKWVARQGPAVILIDHTPKSTDNRGGPQGSQHKRAGVDGAAMYVENVVKFGEGVGQSRVWINKDKHAGVRQNALAKGLWADLNCEPGEGFVLRVPKDNAGEAVAKAAMDSQKLQEAIREVLVENGGNYIPVRDMKAALRDRGAPGSNGLFQDAYKAYKDARE